MRSSAGTNRQYYQTTHLLYPEENQEYYQEIYLSEQSGRLKNQNVVNQNHFLLILLGLLAFAFRGIAKETHWSMIPPEPTSSGKSIDEFIKKKLSEKGLKHSDEASRRILIRRVYLDLLGLVPTPEEVDAFVSDEKKDAYEKLIERVLENPSYGERWARHWLDVVRYADSAGFETNHERPNAYHYRDYVIRAFNEDKPYDQFVFEQVAGDTVGRGSKW